MAQGQLPQPQVAGHHSEDMTPSEWTRHVQNDVRQADLPQRGPVGPEEVGQAVSSAAQVRQRDGLETWPHEDLRDAQVGIREGGAHVELDGE